MRFKSFFLVLFSWGLLGCQEAILHDLDELQANRVRLTLERNSIEAKKIKDGSKWLIQVSEKRVTEALQVIESSRLLRSTLRRIETPEGSLIQSREERLSRLLESRSRSLEDTLQSIPGVLEAHVHLYADSAGKKAKSASVLILLDGEAEPEYSGIQSLVSGASGVPADLVSVINRFVDGGDEDPEVFEGALASAELGQEALALEDKALQVGLVLGSAAQAELTDTSEITRQVGEEKWLSHIQALINFSYVLPVILLLAISVFTFRFLKSRTVNQLKPI